MKTLCVESHRSVIYRAGRSLQVLEFLVPEKVRVPLRFVAAKHLFGGLEPEIAHLSTLVARDRVALDIGANTGTYTYALSKLCSHVAAFEPLERCASMLRAWAPANVAVYAIALGSTTGPIQLFAPVELGRVVTTRASSTPTRRAIRIESTSSRLDDLGFANVGFIKIDVEGAEFEVIKGAEGVIASCRPNLLVEIEARRYGAADLRKHFSLLLHMGYRAHAVVQDRIRPLEEPWRECGEGQVNFIFLHKDGVA